MSQIELLRQDFRVVMPTKGHYFMQQKERLQEEKPRKRKGKKARSQRKDRESVHLARQHEAYFDGGQKAAKGAYGVFYI